VAHVVFRLPLPRQLLRLGNLGRGHVACDTISLVCSELLHVTRRVCRCQTPIGEMTRDLLVRWSQGLDFSDISDRPAHPAALDICEHAVGQGYLGHQSKHIGLELLPSFTTVPRLAIEGIILVV
jgi:hypothetical protein